MLSRLIKRTFFIATFVNLTAFACDPDSIVSSCAEQLQIDGGCAQLIVCTKGTTRDGACKEDACTSCAQGGDAGVSVPGGPHMYHCE